MLEMKEVLVNFFMSLREAFIEEVSEAILETIQENLPHNKNGLIPLSGRLIISLYFYYYYYHHYYYYYYYYYLYYLCCY